MDLSVYDLYYQLEDRHWWFRGIRRMRMAMLHGLVCENPRTLDVACGTGGFILELMNAGHDAYGCDISPKAVGYCRARGLEKAVVADAAALPYGNETFDVVTCNGPLSHKACKSASSVLREMFRVCKGGGGILVNDAACPQIMGRHDEICQIARRYRIAELRALVREAGFEIVRSNHANALLFPIIYTVKRLKNILRVGSAVDIRPTNQVLDRLLRAVMFLEAALIRHVRFPIGAEIMIAARKPVGTPYRPIPLAAESGTLRFRPAN
jgi:ubiquinone/menaquinone biosynthesis C-methylase UbiE